MYKHNSKNGIMQICINYNGMVKFANRYSGDTKKNMVESNSWQEMIQEELGYFKENTKSGNWKHLLEMM